MLRIEAKADVSLSDAGEIEGVAWLFGTPDGVGDVILPGSITFAKSVPMVREHDEGSVVGLWTGFKEDAEKLTVRGPLFIEGIAPARAAREEVKAGKVTGLSLKFNSSNYEKNAHGGTTYKAVHVTEISLCRRPVHPAARITSIKAKKEGTMPEENLEAVAVLEAKVTELTEKVKAFETPDLTTIEERLTKVEAKTNRPETEDDVEQESTEARKAFGTYLRQGNTAPVEELKALTVSSDPQGGFLAPAEMSTEFIRDLVEFSPIRSVASLRTTGAPSVIYPKRTGITNAKWKGETQTQEESEPGFGQAELVVKEVNTFVDVSNQLLADSAGQTEQEVRLALAEDFGQKEGAAFVAGNGVLAPEGFMTNAEIAATANGHATNLAADALIALLYALPASYRNSGAWGMNGTTLAAIRKMKDGQNNYLWQPSYQAGQPETILGRPVVEMIDMPDVASGAFPIIYGDWSGYRIIDRVGLSILVNPYIRATEGITRIHATRRVAGGVLQAAKFRKLKMATS